MSRTLVGVPAPRRPLPVDPYERAVFVTSYASALEGVELNAIALDFAHKAAISYRNGHGSWFDPAVGLL